MKIKESPENNPLEILLELLEKESLDISNFSLAQVADDYLNFLSTSRFQEGILENISDFLWVASRLALLKSKILISTFNFEEVEEEENETEGDLRDRLIEYKKFKEIAKVIGDKVLDSDELFSRKEVEFVYREICLNVNLNDLKKIFNQVVVNFIADNEYIYQNKEIRDTIKIEERIGQIKEMLNKAKIFSFSKTVSNKSSKTEIVVSFLSVLELMKQGVLELRQEDCFKEMKVIKKR